MRALVLVVWLATACDTGREEPAREVPPREVITPAPVARPEAPVEAPVSEARADAPRDHRLTLEHAAFPPVEGAPDVLVHLPEGARLNGPHHVVLFLHGYSGCIEVLAASGEAACREGDRAAPGFGVVEAHDAAGTDTVLVLPQLAWMARDGSPGRLSRSGEARALLEEALEAAGLGRELASVTVAAHSAAFESALAVIRQGGLEGTLRNVVLLDALYSGGPAFLSWVDAGTESDPRTLISIVTGGTPRERTYALVPSARRALGAGLLVDPEEPLTLPSSPARAAFRHVRGAHGDVPRRQLGPTLRALGLPLR